MIQNPAQERRGARRGKRREGERGRKEGGGGGHPGRGLP